MAQLTTFVQAKEALKPYWPAHFEMHRHSLDHIREFMTYLGNPQDKLKAIHVAGTSGKTSTAYYAAALLQAAGKKVGLTISPHVEELNDRVQIDLTPLPEKEFCTSLGEYLDIVEDSGIKLTYFEVLYTFAFWVFVKKNLDYVVVEVGVGGLLDSTNVINREDKICVITDIGLDHLNILGHTLSEIAAHKAGIIQLGNSVFCYRQNHVVMEEILKVAKQKQADLHILDEEVEATQFDFLPRFQQRNLGLAKAAVDWTLERNHLPGLSNQAVKEAAHISIPGRMETVKHGSKTIIIDAAHNSQKIMALRESLHDLYKGQESAALVSLLAGRDYRLEDAAKEMAKLADHLIVTSFSGPEDGPHHSVEPGALAAACRRFGAQNVIVVDDPVAGLQALLNRPEPLLVVAGSFYLLNHVRPQLVD